MVEKDVYHCPLCNFWSKQLCYFHDHVMGHDLESPAFSCSNCAFTSKHRHGINLHIRTKKKEQDGDHEDAACKITPMPEDKYAACFKSAIVPGGVKSGRFVSTFVQNRKKKKKKSSQKKAKKPRVVDALELPEVSAQVLEDFRALGQPEGKLRFNLLK